MQEHMAEKLKKVIDLSPEEKEKIKKAAIAGLSEYSLEKFYERVKGVYERAIKRNW